MAKSKKSRLVQLSPARILLGSAVAIAYGGAMFAGGLFAGETRLVSLDPILSGSAKVDPAEKQLVSPPPAPVGTYRFLEELNQPVVPAEEAPVAVSAPRPAPASQQTLQTPPPAEPGGAGREVAPPVPTPEAVATRTLTRAPSEVAARSSEVAVPNASARQPSNVPSAQQNPGSGPNGGAKRPQATSTGLEPVAATPGVGTTGRRTLSR